MSQLQSSQKPYYLFISSNYCDHSKRLMSQLARSPLINMINIVNVDNPNIELPRFVKSVPTLYIATKRHVLTDNDLFQWFNNELSRYQSNMNTYNQQLNNGNMQQQMRNNGNMQQQNVNVNVSVNDNDNDKILAFHANEMGKGISGSSYSFLDNDKNELVSQNFSFLEDRDINKIPEFTKYNGNGGNGGNIGGGMNRSKTNNAVDQAFEQLMAARKMETQQQRPPQTPNFQSPMY